MKTATIVERRSDRELVASRLLDAPQRVVFEAWTRPELFQRWWVPQSCDLTLLSCDLDVRVGGTYRLAFRHPAAPEPFAVHGRYLDVAPHSRLVWTNEEAGGAEQVTTVTLEDKRGQTQLVLHELYPSKDALDDAITSGGTSGLDETFTQLADLVTTL